MQKVELPGWCQILDELTSETANERDLVDMSEARIEDLGKKWRKKKRGVDAATASPSVDIEHPHMLRRVVHNV